MSDTASRTYTVKRNAGWSGVACEGAPLLSSDESDYTLSGVLNILGRDLGEGSRIRVTVEVLNEEPLPTECIVPWPAHNHRSDIIPHAFQPITYEASKNYGLCFHCHEVHE